MPGDIILHRLDLAVRLIHAVTGDPITDGRAMFWQDGKSLRLGLKSSSDWVGTDIGREDFVLGVNVRGF